MEKIKEVELSLICLSCEHKFKATVNELGDKEPNCPECGSEFIDLNK